MTVFAIKKDSAYPQLRVSDHIVMVAVRRRKGHIHFHPQPAAGITSSLDHSS
jgi:hypothetical protein